MHTLVFLYYRGSLNRFERLDVPLECVRACITETHPQMERHLVDHLYVQKLRC